MNRRCTQIELKVADYHGTFDMRLQDDDTLKVTAIDAPTTGS